MQKIYKEKFSFIKFIQDDSLNFLKNFEQIDFLYLDPLDGQFKNVESIKRN